MAGGYRCSVNIRIQLDRDTATEWLTKMRAALIDKRLFDETIRFPEELFADPQVNEEREKWTKGRNSRDVTIATDIILRNVGPLAKSSLCHHERTRTSVSGPQTCREHDPKELWDAMTLDYAPNTLQFPNAIELRRNFLRAMQGERECRKGWVDRIVAVREKMGGAGVTFTDEDVVIVLMDGLNNANRSFAM
jgi:hypothetical protein